MTHKYRVKTYQQVVQCKFPLTYFVCTFFAVYQIILGTIEATDSADTEWVYKPYMNTTKKRRFLTID